MKFSREEICRVQRLREQPLEKICPGVTAIRTAECELAVLEVLLRQPGLSANGFSFFIASATSQVVRQLKNFPDRTSATYELTRFMVGALETENSHPLKQGEAFGKIPSQERDDLAQFLRGQRSGIFGKLFPEIDKGMRSLKEKPGKTVTPAEVEALKARYAKIRAAQPVTNSSSR